MAKKNSTSSDPLADVGTAAPDDMTMGSEELGQPNTEERADGTPLGGNPATSSSEEHDGGLAGLTEDQVRDGKNAVAKLTTRDDALPHLGPAVEEPVIPAYEPQAAHVAGSTAAQQAGTFTVLRAITLSWGNQMLRLAPGDTVSDGTHGPSTIEKMRLNGVAFVEDMVDPASVPRATTAPNVVPVPESQAAQLRPTGDVGPSAALPQAVTGEPTKS